MTSNVLDFPEIRQVYTYDCGAAALQAILMYYGIDKRESELIKELKVTSEKGTKIKDILRVANKYNIPAVIDKGTTPGLLEEYIKQGYPCLLTLQAYSKNKNTDYSKTYEHGHFVIAIGYDNDGIIFEDPASFYRTYLTHYELLRRWHDKDDKGNNDPQSLCIIFSGKKKYRSNRIINMK